MRNYLLRENGLDDDAAVFHARFWRCYRLLHFIACRVLGDPKRAAGAIENCWLKAARNPHRFEYEGAFRSWLIRVLIDEALALLRDKERYAYGKALGRGSSRAGNSLHEHELLRLNAATEGEY
jgi:DNA-directed RNA polymerase specialized sigma24 family protein